MSTSAIAGINNLLNDRLFQVIGSTPKSIAESLAKIDLKNKTDEGGKIFAVSLFAAAVNKPTLETFLSDARFANIRPLITAAMSISGRANMTALTLLGHCLLTTEMASNVTFATEFRKKMGQNDIWSGELSGGSLSDKQKDILKEKKRLTDRAAANALGSGFLKWVGLDKSQMTRAEADMFNLEVQAVSSTQQGGATAFSVTGNNDGMTSPTEQRVGTSMFSTSIVEETELPDDVLSYRRNILGQSDADIAESLTRNGKEKFIRNTRELIKSDPQGKSVKSASAIGRR